MAMACWNNVSSVSLYLDNVRSSVGEESVRVCVLISNGSLQIYAIGVSFKENIWLAIGSMTSISSCVGLRHGIVFSTAWTGDDGLQACFARGDASTDASSATSRSRLKG